MCVPCVFVARAHSMCCVCRVPSADICCLNYFLAHLNIIDQTSVHISLIFHRVYPLNASGHALDGERPAAYVVQLGDLELTNDWWCDDGIAAQSMLLTAVENGFGGCIIGSVQRERLRDLLDIPDRYKIIQVLALGKPVEEVVIDEMVNGDIKYWRDEKGIHHVPKRGMDELIVNFA